MTPFIYAVVALTILAPTALFIGRSLGRKAERTSRENARETAEQMAKRIVAEAQRDAESAKMRLVIEGEEEVLKVRGDVEQEVRKRRDELQKDEKRFQDRETALDRKYDLLDQRDKDLSRRGSDVGRREKDLDDRQIDLDRMLGEEKRRLEQLAGMSAADAKAELVRRVEEEAMADAANRLREIRETAKKTADREARKIISLAVQRIAAEHTAEITNSAVSLPGDEMKGRIIGREGRNIRAFELATGVDVIIDDTPDTVVVSCFDPVRREVARLALEKLVADGRIHPGRIEEVVAKSQKEVDTSIAEAGEQAAYEAGVHGMHKELVQLVGRMRYRTSYGQNILQHSKECAWLAGIMATELGLDAVMARRAALLHDIGKIQTHDHEGTHVQLGVEIAKKYGEHPLIINAIGAHHDDIPHESEISVLVQAADAISGSRPGARREAFETYVKRLEGIEKIAASYKGVDRVFAIQAGREVRVIVSPDVVDDPRMITMADEIARRIETELQYPGQIRVVMIRETRAVDIAAELIDGTAIAKRIRDGIARDVAALRARGVLPGLTVVLVGDDPASHIYVQRKEQASVEVGMKGLTIRLAATTTQAELLALIDKLNADASVHGILVQSPQPKHIDAQAVIRRIAPEKDVDAFHPVNVGKVLIGDTDGFAPCTPAGVMVLLRESGVDLPGKEAVVVGRSTIVGKPMAALLMQAGADATVTVCHSKTRDLRGHVRRADVLIAAIGRAEMIRGDWLKPGSVVIDVGMNRVPDPTMRSGTRLCGDVHFPSARDIAGKITPVPGGVGPMTIAMLLQNTVRAATAAGARQ